VGDFPFCPHGAYRGGVEQDSIIGGFEQENFGDQPEVFYSKKAMLARADELGLQPYVKRLEKVREIVGGGKQWLADAEELAKRNGTASGEDLTWKSFKASVREIKSLSEVA
jgi:hypothetical protein